MTTLDNCEMGAAVAKECMVNSEKGRACTPISIDAAGCMGRWRKCSRRPIARCRPCLADILMTYSSELYIWEFST